MKKKICGFLVFQFLIFFTGLSQPLYIVDKIPDTIQFKTFIDSSGFQINTNTFQISDKFPSVRSLAIQDGDLILTFTISKKNYKYNPDIIQIIGLIVPEGKMIEPLDYKLKVDDSDISGSSLPHGIRIWQDVTEDMIRNDQEYRLIIERGIADVVDCQAAKPVFGSREKWPHLAFAGLGLVSIGVGQIYKNQMNDEYNQYKNAWIDGEVKDEAQQYYNKAEKSQSQAEIWTYTGMAIIGIDLILYTYRWYTTKNKQKKWDEFCAPNRTVGINISAEPNITGTMTTSLGISVQF